MAKWFINDKEVTLREYKNFLKGDKNVIDVVEKEEIKIKSNSELLFEELTNEVGFSHKRANKVIEIYKSKDELIDNLEKLPFEKIENETLVKYFGKKIKKKVKKIIEGEI